jgi:hypothetical protein
MVGLVPIEERTKKGHSLTMSTILLVILILLLVGVFPAWPHSRKWGYGPTGGLGLILIILIILALMGRI